MLEDIIKSLRQTSLQQPICWLVCYEDRPLQGLPPSKNDPHIMIFSTQARALDFLKGRRKYYSDEPLSVVGIDTMDTLKELVVLPAHDPNYAPPPCGILVDFDYSLKRPYHAIPPEKATMMDAGEIALALNMGFPKQEVEASKASPLTTQSERPGMIVAGWLKGILVIAGCTAIGVVAWVYRNQIPLARSEPTSVPTATATVTVPPTSKPIILSTRQPTDTPVPDFLAHPPTGVEDVLRESFDNNQNVWKAYYPGRVASVKDGHIRVVSYESGYVSVATCDGCGEYRENFYLQADLTLNKFQNVSYGVVFCTNENNNYYVFLINHNSFKYSLFRLKDDEWITLIDATSSDHINPYPHTNTLSVYYEQGRMELFVNGFMVNSYTDTDPLSGGVVGLIVDDAGAELYGDNVFIYQR